MVLLVNSRRRELRSGTSFLRAAVIEMWNISEESRRFVADSFSLCEALITARRNNDTATLCRAEHDSI